MRNRMATLCAAALLLVLIPSLVFATTRRVRQDGSGDFLTIGAAVAASVANDIIEVGPGTYFEKVDVFWTLTFISTHGAANTIMDGSSINYTLWFRAGTGHSVDGFTFQNGFHISGGGAIRCQAGARLTLRNSELRLNRSGHDGGAIFTRDANSFIDAYDCVFRSNYAEHNGSAGIAILGSRINYTRCQFYSHTCGEQNAGVSCDNSSMDVRNCLFVGNSSESFAGIYYHVAQGIVQENTLYGNYGGQWGAVVIHNGSIVTLTRNIIANTTGGWGVSHLTFPLGPRTCNVYWNNENGPSTEPLGPTEVEADPLFCNVLNNNFGISAQSPAAPAHNPCDVLAGAYGIGCGPVSVAISSFEATQRDGGVVLRGTFNSTLGAKAVNIYRGEGDASMLRLGSIDPNRDRFEYRDDSVTPGKTYRYQVGVVDDDGEFMSLVERIHVDALRNALDQNRPNPFNPTTTIHYSMAAAGRVSLVVYDAAGRTVRRLVDENQNAGARDVSWDGRDDHGSAVASGVYFYRLSAGKFTETKRMVMLK